MDFAAVKYWDGLGKSDHKSPQSKIESKDTNFSLKLLCLHLNYDIDCIFFVFGK